MQCSIRAHVQTCIVHLIRASLRYVNYYGAFVLDPDGHNVEVVNHNL